VSKESNLLRYGIIKDRSGLLDIPLSANALAISREDQTTKEIPLIPSGMSLIRSQPNIHPQASLDINEQICSSTYGAYKFCFNKSIAAGFTPADLAL
jgi:hypothetical protein